MLKLKINDNEPIEAQVADGKVLLDEKALDWDIQSIGEGKFHIIHGHQSYRAEVVSADYKTKAFEVKVNGNTYQIEARDRFDMLLEKMGMANNAQAKVNQLKAPMPGKILDIMVSPGDTVAKGDKVLTLEAMKMENVLKSPADVTIKDIKISVGENVEKGHVMITFE